MQAAQAPGRSPALPVIASGPDSDPARFSIRILTTPSEFSAIAPEWEVLHGEAPAASIFNSWMFQYAWWEVHGRPPLRIVVARDGMRTVGILPLYVSSETALGLPVRVLRNLGTGGVTNPDDLGPLLAPRQQDAAARALASHLVASGGFDVARLDDMDGRCPFAARALEVAEDAGRAARVERAQRINYIDLPRDLNAYLATMTSRRRARQRYLRSKLASAHRARFFVWDDAANVQAAAERLAALHRKRFAQASTAFIAAEYNELHLSAMKDCLSRDRLRLYCLELDGKIAAIQYCFRFRKSIFAMQSGFDPAYARWSPGAVLLGYAIEHAIAEGNQVFDFLRGSHGYKEALATGTRETVRLTVFRPTVGAAAYRASSYLPDAKAKVQGLAQALKARHEGRVFRRMR